MTITVYAPVNHGWRSASLGVILRTGSSWVHLSKRSMKLLRCFNSSSLIFIWTLEAGSNLDLRSLVAFDKTKVLATS